MQSSFFMFNYLVPLSSSGILDFQLCKNWRSYPGFKIPNPENCQTFYACVPNHFKKGGYQAVLKKCSSRSGFDSRLGVCNHLDYVPSCLTGSFHFYHLVSYHISQFSIILSYSHLEPKNRFQDPLLPTIL